VLARRSGAHERSVSPTATRSSSPHWLRKICIGGAFVDVICNRYAGTHLRLTEMRKEKRTMKVRYLVASLSVASIVLMGAVGSARAADEWFVLGEQTIKSADQGVTIKSEGARWAKDIKQMRIGVEGADVEIKKVVLGWDNRPDVTITDIGVLKAGGNTTPKEAPGRKGRLKSVTVEYKIVGTAPTATLKVWGYD
jgi:hypothetical protein